MSELLYSVEEVFSDSGYLKEQNKKNFFIPEYQRGFKWKSKDVVKLLEDVYNFKISGNKFYCLQNITIVPNEKNEEFFNVVDGQQRLTTLTIILSYLDKKELVKNKVIFPTESIRKETNFFVNGIITNESMSFPSEDWEEFIAKNPDYDHQDIYHIFQAYIATRNWFIEKKKSGLEEVNFLKKLTENVKFIVNKIEGNKLSEEKIFGNLNSKRVPLDGADLIRAIIITHVANEESKRESDIKNIVRVNERRVKLGWELDQINNWWADPNVKDYFLKFIEIGSEELGGHNLFDSNRFPINQLYLLFAESKDQKELSMNFIENESFEPISFYKSLLKLNYTLQDWYQDKDIYHFLGFIFNHRKKKKPNFNEIWGLWNKCETRIEFILELKEIIKSIISVEDEIMDYSDIELDWYVKFQEQLIPSLILLDIISILNKSQHSFLPPESFTKSNNDIEHIFPQNPKQGKDKKSYIEFLDKHINKGRQFDKSKFAKADLNDENLINEMNDHISGIIKDFRINSIGNLVLLYNSLNRSISNSPYDVKRARIVQYYNQGYFIQPHTFQVFVRYYNSENRDFQHWTNDDIKANANFINETINNFFKI